MWKQNKEWRVLKKVYALHFRLNNQGIMIDKALYRQRIQVSSNLEQELIFLLINKNVVELEIIYILLNII